MPSTPSTLEVALIDYRNTFQTNCQAARPASLCTLFLPVSANYHVTITLSYYKPYHRITSPLKPSQHRNSLYSANTTTTTMQDNNPNLGPKKPNPNRKRPTLGHLRDRPSTSATPALSRQAQLIMLFLFALELVSLLRHRSANPGLDAQTARLRAIVAVLVLIAIYMGWL
jgi:hypothetical protein